MNWYKFQVRDYLISTSHLADAEDLAYRRLLDLYYLSEKSIPGPVSAIAQRIKLDIDCVQPVLDEFFTIEDGRYHHPVIDEDIAKRQHQRVVNGISGKVGGSRPKPRGPRKRRDSMESIAPATDLLVSVGRITVA